jgi:tRNA(Ser,Leu) C12 N-acetylase TAN1
VLTCPDLYAYRRMHGALRRVLPDAQVIRTAFRAVVMVECEGDVLTLAKGVTRECGPDIGHATAVLEEVPSERGALAQAAARVGAEHIRPGESFAFRLRKRGAHGYVEDTPDLEREIGSAIWVGLEAKFGREPLVNLSDPDVVVRAEVLGPVTLVGVVRKAWRIEPAAGEMPSQ